MTERFLLNRILEVLNMLLGHDKKVEISIRHSATVKVR